MCTVASRTVGVGRWHFHSVSCTATPIAECATNSGELVKFRSSGGQRRVCDGRRDIRARALSNALRKVGNWDGRTSGLGKLAVRNSAEIVTGDGGLPGSAFLFVAFAPEKTIHHVLVRFRTFLPVACKRVDSNAQLLAQE